MFDHHTTESLMHLLCMVLLSWLCCICIYLYSIWFFSTFKMTSRHRFFFHLSDIFRCNDIASFILFIYLFHRICIYIRPFCYVIRMANQVLWGPTFIRHCCQSGVTVLFTRYLAILQMYLVLWTFSQHLLIMIWDMRHAWGDITCDGFQRQAFHSSMNWWPVYRCNECPLKFEFHRKIAHPHTSLNVTFNACYDCISVT